MALKSRTLPILSTIFGVALLTSAAFAQETAPPTQSPSKADKVFKGDKIARKGFGGRHGKRAGFGLRGIELTEAQKAQIKSIREANRPDQAAIAEMKAIRGARRSGQELTADQKARIQAMREQAGTKGKAVREQILAVLTPEQRAQIDARRTEMKEKFKNRRHDGPKRKAPGSVEKPSTL